MLIFGALITFCDFLMTYKLYEFICDLAKTLMNKKKYLAQ